jgi:hypothetical protein
LEIKRSVPFIFGAVYLAAALFFALYVGGWWRIIPAAVLMWMSWAHLKTGLFAADKEIEELCSDEPLSEETKRDFRDRLGNSGGSRFWSEILVRRPALIAFEDYLRRVIPDDDTRYDTAGQLLLYSENSSRRSQEQHTEFRMKLETMLTKGESDRLIFTARKMYSMYGFVLRALKVVFVILFLVGTWGFASLFTRWGWDWGISFVTATFIVGAILELGKWAFLRFDAR